MLRYARCHFAPWNSRCLERAALKGHRDIVDFLLKHNAPVESPTRAAIYAAEGGHLDLIILFHSRGFQFDERVAEQAAEMGHLDILQFIFLNNLPWHPQTCLQACSRPSEYVREEYGSQIGEIRERLQACRAWIGSIFGGFEVAVVDGIDAFLELQEEQEVQDDAVDETEEEEEEEEEEEIEEEMPFLP